MMTTEVVRVDVDEIGATLKVWVYDDRNIFHTAATVRLEREAMLEWVRESIGHEQASEQYQLDFDK